MLANLTWLGFWLLQGGGSLSGDLSVVAQRPVSPEAKQRQSPHTSVTLSSVQPPRKGFESWFACNMKRQPLAHGPNCEPSGF